MGISDRVQSPAAPATSPTLRALSDELLSRLQSGETLGSAADLALAEQLGQTLAAAANVHANAFSAQRYHDLLSPILAQVSRDDLAGATIVDLGCGTVNPFTFSFLLLMLGAERAYAIDTEPVHDMGAATRALAAAAGWLLVDPARVLDRPSLRLEDVAGNLRGFDLSRLAAGDPAGLAPGRLTHRIEPVSDLSLRSGEADLVVSVSLLEHLHPVDDALESLRRITKPGGLGIHVIDLVDHRFYSGAAASPLEFLKEPASSALVHGSNRLRCHQWCAAFEQHGFAVERVEQWASQPPPRAEDQAGFAEPYRSMAPEQIKTTGARLFVRREGTSAGRAGRRLRASDVPELAPTGVLASAAGDAAAGGAAGAAVQAYQRLLATAVGTRDDEYVPLRDDAVTGAQALVKLIAFYLPQFHPIPQNDEWWGRGFTEWTNVSKAVPQFAGHYQPHLPGELGFYDLRVPEVQQRQVALARHYGVAGFCFYHYWFGGTRLLERPLEQFMANPAIDFPFCVCWANENWTRRWDGHEDKILMAQDHGHETDAAYIAELEPMLRHRNYIHIHGRPVVLVYRPMLLRDPAATAARWRAHCRRVGLPDPYLVATEAFDTVDPAAIGFDAAVEFPPNTGGRALPGEITADLALANPAYTGTVYRYEDMWRGKIDRPRPAYTLFKAVCPGFDNEPRRPGNGATYAFSSPASYGRWLEVACRATLAEPDPEKRLVFVNAWNEWAEGAHLEPDRRFGYAYLDATAKVLAGLQHDWTMLVVSHDACRGGAQLVLLEYLEWLKRHTAVRLKVLCLAPGEWLPRFRDLADTALMADLEARARQAGEGDITGQVLNFCGGPPALVYGNSVASGRAYAALHRLNAPIVTHVHELESSIARYAAGWFDDVLALTAHFIACSEPVRANLIATHGVAPRVVSTVHASIAPGADQAPPDEAERAALRARLGLAAGKTIVMGCGLGMPFRKGADLFIEVARRLRQQGRTDIHLYWVGGFPDGERDEVHGAWADWLATLDASDAPAVTFLGVHDDARPFLRAADLFLVTSREDPFPLVALEAGQCGVPVICFDAAGGMPTFVEADAGIVVPFEDVAAMAAAVAELCADEPRRRALGARARQKVSSRFVTDVTAPHLLSVCRAVAGRKPAVSVIVPNYNHGRYLRQRLDSIFTQTFRDAEVIVLDDASSDDSLQVIDGYRDRADVRVVTNEANSGSTFAQWLKGLDLARADVIWIAESDDGCEPEFLATLLPALRDPRVTLAYANSHVWNEHGAVVGDYTSTPYLASLSATKWAAAYRVPAEQEINDGLGVKNTILSASAVLFKRFALDDATRRRLESMRLAGDWLFFAQALRGGEIYYTPRKLNFHRRHDESVVGKLLKDQRVEQFFAEFYTVQSWIWDHYQVDDRFEAKWEQYLREQWAAFFPDRPFDELNRYYPVANARERIGASRSRPPGTSR